MATKLNCFKYTYRFRISHKTLSPFRLLDYRGSGQEVLKRERGHVTSETGVAEVAVFGALQPNVCEIVQLSQNKPKGNSIPGDNHGLTYIPIYPPGDKGLMYIHVY